ncbi:MAG: hypothetical protein EXR41_04675 [Candidatus Methylopumilus sp.]|nr:hypothetical protein [Candidatus Methylopumilus sp.]
MQKILVLMFVLLVQMSCVSPLMDKNSNSVPQKLNDQCKQECAVYGTNSRSIVGSAMCVDTCLRSNGY